MEGGVERALFHLQLLARDHLDVSENPEAVLGTPRQGSQDQHVQRPLQHRNRFELCRHRLLQEGRGGTPLAARRSPNVFRYICSIRLLP